MWSWRDSTLPNAATRIGITEVKWIAGLYSFWDQIRAAKPGAVVDHCSGGGRNIDLETISRGIWKWRSDYDGCDSTVVANAGCNGNVRNRTQHPGVAISHQSMTMGLSQYHPMNAHFAYWADAYSWRSVTTRRG